ncbi:MAG: gamma-glutamylcyclotransferase [Hyphomicrobiaceae bacterium]|nr:gamma-glutamylcyclotransferase [Hyphomicrobiaceae bacterium]
MAQHLFVYGTLLSGARNPMGVRLGREGRLVGPAAIKGRLYDLGRYPALVEAGPDDREVHGEVYALTSPEASLRWLDAYEGIVPGREGSCDYERVERTLRLAAGGELAAWVYLYRASVHGRRAIDSGRWLAPAPGS